MSRPSIIERRAKPRVETKLRVKISGLDEEIETFAGNLSKRGLFLETLTPLAEVGEKIHFEISFPKSTDCIKVTGKVARVTRPNVSSPQGMAIEFLRVEARQARAFERFLDQLLMARGIGSRKYPRAHTRIVVEIRNRDGVREGISENLSRGGLFLKIPVDAFALGEVMSLVLVHPNGRRRFPLTGEVVHIRQGESALRHDFVEGLGVQFIDQPSSREQDLVAFLKSILAHQRKG